MLTARVQLRIESLNYRTVLLLYTAAAVLFRKHNKVPHHPHSAIWLVYQS